MITKLSKTSAETLDYIAEFVFTNKPFLNQSFPLCDSKTSLREALMRSGDRWTVLISDQPIALLAMRTVGATAIVERFCPATPDVIPATTSALREYLSRLKAAELEMKVSEDLAESFAKNGFEKRSALLRLTANVVETKTMPILPLSNPTGKDIPALANLMLESYAKSNEKRSSEPAEAERELREIMTEARGPFLPDSSFISKAADKIVSACFLTLTESVTGDIIELFTHPLYRARGLATTEIALSMNRLLKRKIPTLSVWLSESNDVAKRLFSKLNFKEDSRLRQVAMRIQ